MSRDFRRSAVILLVWVGSAILSANAFAKTPTPCLSPLPSGEIDPSVRNVTLFPAADGTNVTVQACIVSNKDRLASLSVIFSVFDGAGNFISAGGQTLGAQSSVSGTTPSQPRIIAIAASGLTTPRSYGGHLLPTVLVQIQWSACIGPKPDECVSGPVTSSTFLRESISALDVKRIKTRGKKAK